MKGKVCLITGANSGIGKATALELAAMGATLVIVARDKQKGENAMSEIRSDTGNNSIELLLADLSSLQSVRELAQQFQAKYSKLHVLINNAGLLTKGDT
jgi:NAD(P)-dependent dehydrogenase (short-subunit alcohol dehydrogenase family)